MNSSSTELSRDDVAAIHERCSEVERYVSTRNYAAWVNCFTPDAVFMFANSPTFKLADGADRESLEKLAWFDTKTPLRSGWAWGQQYLDGGVAMIDAKVGDGRLTMFGPQILFRGQPHGTFKFLFNGIYYGGAEPVSLP